MLYNLLSLSPTKLRVKIEIKEIIGKGKITCPFANSLLVIDFFPTAFLKVLVFGVHVKNHTIVHSPLLFLTQILVTVNSKPIFDHV